MKKTLIYILIAFPSLTLATDLYPLAVGNEWTYEVKKVGPYYPCKEGLEVMKISGLHDVSGVSGYKTEFCGYSSVIRRSGEEILSYFAGKENWFTYLGTPIDKHKWSEFHCESQWDYIGKFKTPMGELDNCFKKTRGVAYTHIEVFCDKVGLVHDKIRDLGGNGWDRWLVKKNF